LWAQYKGIQVIGTGDFAHPQWLKELQDKLEPAESGLFKLKDKWAKPLDAQIPTICRGPVRFMLTVEISTIYKRQDKVRKLHQLIFTPSFESARKIQAKLGSIGNIASDGRPILGLDAYDLLKLTLDADTQNLFVPAHIWTPWFSALGSMGGFDSMTDAFGDLTKHIYAVETGLSSDPPMNWRLKQLDDFILISNSDAHSPSKLGREANIFDTDFSYDGIYKALSDKNDKGLVSTLEFSLKKANTILTAIGLVRCAGTPGTRSNIRPLLCLRQARDRGGDEPGRNLADKLEGGKSSVGVPIKISYLCLS